MTCLYCGEEVLPREQSRGTSHEECSARAVLGSVGHLLGLCSCHGGPGTYDDPPGLTKRQAARLAWWAATGRQAILEWRNPGVPLSQAEEEGSGAGSEEREPPVSPFSRGGKPED